MPQPEAELENKLIEALIKQGYSFVKIGNETDLVANLKTQIEKHNGISLTQKEFGQVLIHLNKGNIWDRAKILRDKMQLTKEDGTSVYLEFINQEFWCQNQYQVCSQISNEGDYKNRYDVTILINGLPLCQIELKRRGLELKEAFNQTHRYQRHSYSANYGLFQYIQVFVISNGVNTKYYSNNLKQNFKQTFYWSDKNNKLITDLFAFTDDFLEPCHLSKMITRYIVLSEKDSTLMVLRPYQYFAVEAILDRVKNTPANGPTKNGYIWHTTGSGKTLTSFKASQILVTNPNIHKVVFVVDRKDLDYQTTKEFNSFSDGSVDGTDNTQKLVEQFTNETKLIVTTIQKLNTAISKIRHLNQMEKLKDKRIVFIFDECHRTQFGETHARIKSYFTNNQMFGFTGTPIFEQNAASMDGRKRTTKELFEECLHKYVITDAIKDENVLKFSVEYVGRYRQKESQNELDIEVEGIDTQELLESPKRLDKIADYIIAHHDQKTHSRAFTAMFCVSSVDILTQYYDIFAKKKLEGKHNLRIATVFSYVANEDVKDNNGNIELDELDNFDFNNVAEPEEKYQKLSMHNRDKLEKYIGDYNKMFGTKHSTKDSQAFYNYYNEISKRVKNKEIDILLVVNMFLTGFDSKTLNTLFVDKNLKFHGLIQAFSRTNRILDDKKSHGNIVCFRNLKNATDDAIALFSNKNAKEDIILKPYGEYINRFNQVYAEILKITPTVESVNDLASEDDILVFVQKFRELIRIKNTLSTFADYEEQDLVMPSQDFEDYKSKYLDIHDKAKSSAKEKVSILNDVDFELELIHRDEVNVAYILMLLAKLNIGTQEDLEKKKKEIKELLEGQIQLRSKKILIEKFINENLPNITDADQVEGQFEEFWSIERANALISLAKAENLDLTKLQEVIAQYLFSQKLPLVNEIRPMLTIMPGLRDRNSTFSRIKDKILEFIETFIEGV
jgi:type I restriction enzyme, R subunit